MPKTSRVATSSCDASNTNAKIAVIATAKKTEIAKTVICQQFYQTTLLRKPRATSRRDLSAARANLLLGVVGVRQTPTDAKRPVGVISLIGGYGGLHPL